MIELGHEVFACPAGNDEYVTVDGLRGLCDEARGVGDNGNQYIKATVVALLPKRWWQRRPRQQVVDGALVLASVVVRRPQGTTTPSMAAAWLHRSGDHLPYGGEYAAEPDAVYGVLESHAHHDDYPSVTDLMGEVPAQDTTVSMHPADASTATFPAIPAADPDGEDLPALTGPRRSGRHAAS